MPTIHQLQADAIMSNEKLAYEAKISVNTLRKLKRGDPTAAFVVGKVLRALGHELGRKIEANEIEGITIS